MPGFVTWPYGKAWLSKTAVLCTLDMNASIRSHSAAVVKQQKLLMKNVCYNTQLLFIRTKNRYPQFLQSSCLLCQLTRCFSRMLLKIAKIWQKMLRIFANHAKLVWEAAAASKIAISVKSCTFNDLELGWMPQIEISALPPRTGFVDPELTFRKLEYHRQCWWPGAVIKSINFGRCISCFFLPL